MYKIDKSIKISKSDEKYIGKTFNSKSFGKFKVLGINSLNKQRKKLYLIEFLDTGGKNTVKGCHILSGSVKDYLKPIFFNVGCLGYPKSDVPINQDRALYNKWKHMLERCYNEDNKAYHYYGGIGVKVCNRWHRYDFFIEDYYKLPILTEDINIDRKKLHLDKDIKGDKIYSPSNCILVDRKINLQNSSQVKLCGFNNINDRNKMFVKLHNNNISKKELSKIYNLDYTVICDIIKRG